MMIQRFLQRASGPIVIGLMTLGVSWWTTGAVAQEAIPAPPGGQQATGDEGVVNEEDVEVLARGPLHEAYARPFSGEAVPGEVVSKAPPEPIEEIPPEVALEGDDVEWIPGYWGWDPDQQDYVWVSGVWRRVPPGQKWVPGYWRQTDQGYQWVSGFWMDEGADEISYLPTPPETLDLGPTSPSPGDDYFWIPGTWSWQLNQYVWRPGYWSPLRTNWVWVPAQYIWTPRGCVYNGGYWDYVLANRGLLYAPVYFRRPIYLSPRYYYVPSYVVSVPYTLVSWFVAPRYHHYFFGNYYGLSLGGFQLLPWYTFGIQRTYYDPLLIYYRSYYRRHNADFIGRLSRWHNYYHRHADRRPPKWVHRDWDGRRDGRRGDRDRNRPDRFDRAVVPVSRWASNEENRGRVRRIEENQRRDVAQRSERWREIRSFRGREENDARRVADARRGGDGQRGDRGRLNGNQRRDVDRGQARQGPLIAPDRESRVRLPEALRGQGNRPRAQRGNAAVTGRGPEGQERPGRSPRAWVGPSRDGQPGGRTARQPRPDQDARRGQAQDRSQRFRQNVPAPGERPGVDLRGDDARRDALRRSLRSGSSQPRGAAPRITPDRPESNALRRGTGQAPPAVRPDADRRTPRSFDPRQRNFQGDRSAPAPRSPRGVPQQLGPSRPDTPLQRGRPSISPERGRPPIQMDRAPRPTSPRATSPRAVRPNAPSPRGSRDTSFRRAPSPSRSIRSVPQSRGRGGSWTSGGGRGRSSFQGNRGGGGHDRGHRGRGHGGRR